MKGGFKKWFADMLEGSAIMRAVSKLSASIYKRIGSGVYGFIFGSYDTVCETYDDGALGRQQMKKRGRLSMFLSRNIENSIYINMFSAMLTYLSRLSMRVIGVFLISSGFYTLLAQTLVFLITNSTSMLGIGVGAFLIVAGLPLLLSQKPLCRVMADSAFVGWIIRDFCGFNKLSLKYDGMSTGKKGMAFILGLPFGILSCFINPALVVILLVGLIVMTLILLNPEAGYNLMVFSLPFLVVLPHPTIILAGVTLFTVASLVLKLVLGKRTFKFELLDVLILCFIAVMVVGGFVSYGGSQSIAAASIYASLILGYFLTVGLVNSKDALKRTVKILGFSMLLVAIYGLYQNFSGNVSAEWIDTDMFEAISGRVVSTFENPNMLGEYLILLLPVIAACVFGEKTVGKKSTYFITFALGSACLVYTWARGAWLGFMLAAVMFMLMWNRKAMGLIVAGAAAFPFAIPFLPESIVSRFSSIGDLTDTSTNYRVFIWRGSANLAADYALTGIGVGERAFSRVYPYYAFAGIETAPHAHNLFLQLFIEVGIFGFIVFMAVMICMLQSGFSLAKNGEDKEVRLIGCGALCGVLAALLQGMTDYIWYNYRVFFIFWIVIGIISAARRIDKATRANKIINNNDYMADITL